MFGDLVRKRRRQINLSLRSFAQLAGMDPGNASRLERGLVAAPESAHVLCRLAKALGLRPGNPDYEELMDAAAAAKGRIPTDLLADEGLASRLPMLFKTLRRKALTGEELDDLIESIRRR
jgi:transcriptional regulator with XRE-family HTH domain